MKAQARRNKVFAALLLVALIISSLGLPGPLEIPQARAYTEDFLAGYTSRQIAYIEANGENLTNYPFQVAVYPNGTIFENMISAGGDTRGLLFDNKADPTAFTQTYEPGQCLVTPKARGNYLYELWFTGLVPGANGVYYINSTDGINWSNAYATNITGGYEDIEVLREQDGTLTLYCERNADDVIAMFEGIDALTFQNESIAISKGGPGAWDEWLVGSPVVWDEDDTRYMIYEGMDLANKTGWIGLATSTDTHHKSWSKSGSNPVIKAGEKYYEEKTIVSSSIILMDSDGDGEDEYFLGVGTTSWEVHQRSWMGDQRKRWYHAVYWSEDLITWTKPDTHYTLYDNQAIPLNATGVEWFYDPQNEDYRGYAWNTFHGFYLIYPDRRSSVRCDNLVQDDFDDIRFTDDSNTPLDHYLLEKVDGVYALFEVEIPTIDTRTPFELRIYFGNATVSSASNGADTYFFYDSFEGGAVNLTWWNATVTNGGTVAVSSLNATQGSQSALINGTHAVTGASVFTALMWGNKTLPPNRNMIISFKHQPLDGGPLNSIQLGGYISTAVDNRRLTGWINASQNIQFSGTLWGSGIQQYNISANEWFHLEQIITESPASLESGLASKGARRPVNLYKQTPPFGGAPPYDPFHQLYSGGGYRSAHLIDEYIIKTWTTNEPSLNDTFTATAGTPYSIEFHFYEFTSGGTLEYDKIYYALVAGGDTGGADQVASIEWAFSTEGIWYNISRDLDTDADTLIQEWLTEAVEVQIAGIGYLEASTFDFSVSDSNAVTEVIPFKIHDPVKEKVNIDVYMRVYNEAGQVSAWSLVQNDYFNLEGPGPSDPTGSGGGEPDGPGPDYPPGEETNFTEYFDDWDLTDPGDYVRVGVELADLGLTWVQRNGWLFLIILLLYLAYRSLNKGKDPFKVRDTVEFMK